MQEVLVGLLGVLGVDRRAGDLTKILEKVHSFVCIYLYVINFVAMLAYSLTALSEYLSRLDG